MFGMSARASMRWSRRAAGVSRGEVRRGVPLVATRSWRNPAAIPLSPIANRKGTPWASGTC